MQVERRWVCGTTAVGNHSHQPPGEKRGGLQGQTNHQQGHEPTTNRATSKPPTGSQAIQDIRRPRKPRAGQAKSSNTLEKSSSNEQKVQTAVRQTRRSPQH